MEARTTRRPGQKGTKRLLQRFGDRLLFVRYRYDPAGRRRVVLIVDEQPWAPRPDRALHTGAPPPPANPSDPALLRIEPHELETRAKVKAAGGTWDPVRRVWILSLRRARVLGLQERIVPTRS